MPSGHSKPASRSVRSWSETEIATVTYDFSGLLCYIQIEIDVALSGGDG